MIEDYYHQTIKMLVRERTIDISIHNNNILLIGRVSMRGYCPSWIRRVGLISDCQ